MIIHAGIPPTPITTISRKIVPCLRRETTLLIDHDHQYVPVLVTHPEHQLLQSAGFSLAAIDLDAGHRLQRLVGFIRQMSAANPSGSYIPCSHGIAEQIACLSYWKDLTLEFWLELVGDTPVVTARFPREPGLTCTLDVFPHGDCITTGKEIEQWFDFLCQVVREHAPLWQIHLVADSNVLARLTTTLEPPGVLVEVVDGE